MEKLGYYEKFFTERENNAKDARCGYLLELAVKDYFGLPLEISKPGKTDITVEINGHKRKAEIKQNGGDFRHACKGNSFIFYAVYIDESKTLAEQFGYIMPMTVFKKAGAELKHIRDTKTDSKGLEKMSLQTLYNYSKGDFHGAKAFKLADRWEELEAVSFKEFFK